MDNFDLRMRRLAAGEKEMLPTFVEDRIQSALAGLPDNKIWSAAEAETIVIEQENKRRFLSDDSADIIKKSNISMKLLPAFRKTAGVVLMILVLVGMPIALLQTGGSKKASTTANTDRSETMKSSSSQALNSSEENGNNEFMSISAANIIDYTIPKDGDENVSRSNMKIIIGFKNKMNRDIEENGNIEVIDDSNSKDITGLFQFSYNPNNNSLELVSKKASLSKDVGSKISVIIPPGLKDSNGNSQAVKYSFSFTVK